MRTNPLYSSIVLESLSRVCLFATPWTEVYQAPPPVGFCRQEHEWVAMPSCRGSSRPSEPPRKVLSVTEQLDAGVRYLDLRIAHMEEGSERNLHFVHMVYTTALVEDTLTEISEWLEGHPREVVILACRNFEGMTEGLHEYLVGCIKNIFGDMLCPRGEVPTLRQLWSRGQQVILSYEDEAAVSRHVELWPGIPYWWGNKVKPQDLVHYLERMKSCGRPGGLFVAGINLTENLEFILVHPAWSLQKLTLSGLPYLCAWVRAQCPGSAAGCTNIIAGDFIGASGFVSDVIGLNRKLLRG
ncbi:PI-PLC X domain-containing protein 1 isoform X5 [Ovis aries]|uniref:PI-PLC X domain-containing protein 1 isoform X5 n=1 Tax=Ovis aries TaxID=9940 RepID=UPI0029526957|nr:PI-PLC X domain-containing protein 1 isoform X5 [Ovis aries]XP_060264536.1 PI-PLC X domain-containing protein 1 isoform X5 [Ovis aries]